MLYNSSEFSCPDESIGVFDVILRSGQQKRLKLALCEIRKTLQTLLQFRITSRAYEYYGRFPFAQ